MAKKRNAENKGLPSRWKHYHNAYYYMVPPGLEAYWEGKKQFRLGKTLPEAYKAWSERLGMLDKAATIGQLLDRYALEVIPAKRVTTQRQDQRVIRPVRAVFGDMPLTAIKPSHIYTYYEKRKRKGPPDRHGKPTGGPRTAKQEIALLSHAYTKAVQWGYLDRHPFKKEVRIETGKARDRYVEDWEILECLMLDARRKKGSVKLVQAYIKLKLLIGLRCADILRIREADIREDGIYSATSKTGKPRVFTWTEELRLVVADIRALRPVHSLTWLFCTRRGRCYVDPETGLHSGWDSMWQRFMERVLDETKVEERFTEHDLRAKCASDAETLEHAQALLAHADSRITKRVYRRKPERVRPAK